MMPQAGERDLARPRVPDAVVGVAVAVGEVAEAGAAGAEGVRGAGAGEDGDDVAGPDRALLRLPAGRARRPLEVHAVAFEHDEQLLGAAVRVRRRAAACRRQLEVPQRRALRAGLGADGPPRRRAVAAVARRRPRHAVEVDDARRPRRGPLRQLELAGRGLLRVRVRRVAGLDPAAAQPGHLRPRQVAGLGDAALAEGEDVEAVGAGDEGVGRPLDEVHEAVAGGDLVGLAALPAQPGPGEDEEDLLLAAVRVRRRGAPARRHLDASQPDRAGCRPPCRGHARSPRSARPRPPAAVRPPS